MYYVYVLASQADNSQYVGMIIPKEITKHNNKKHKSTKAKAPWKLVYKANYKTGAEARNREKYLKSAAGRRFRKSLNMHQ